MSFYLKETLNHDLKLVFSNTYKLKSYEYDINGLAKEAYVKIKNHKSIPLFKENLKNSIISKKQELISISNQLVKKHFYLMDFIVLTKLIHKNLI